MVRLISAIVYVLPLFLMTVMLGSVLCASTYIILVLS